MKIKTEGNVKSLREEFLVFEDDQSPNENKNE